MEYNSDTFSWQFPIVKQFLYHYVCYKELSARYIETGIKSEFWEYTIDAHIKLAMMYWTKVFGAEGPNPTHWKNLSDNAKDELVQSFRNGLIKALGLSENEWHEYGKTIREFRDKYIAHTDPEFLKPVPYLDKAVRVAYFYDEWVRELIKPDSLEEPYLKGSVHIFRKEVAELSLSLMSM